MGLVAAEIIIRIKDKDGKTVAEIKVPDGGSIETVDDSQGLPAPETLEGYGGKIGDKFTFRVTGATTGSVWGTGPYTLDSGLATAAVHAAKARSTRDRRDS